MALYYNLGSLYEKYHNDANLVQDYLTDFCKEASKMLKKMKLGIEDKDHAAVRKWVLRMQPNLEFLGIDEGFEEGNSILEWADRSGKKKEVKEIFKAFKVHVKNATKELKKDFVIAKKLRE
ncbi:histidine kinase [Flavobacterium sp. JP2137]|uniref:histidine kinase n=1 Tax=Flavobacterium sp. JP2137 TaxID=3414510 RepID=UPI003D2FBB34